LNIQQFAAALDTGQEVKACREEIGELKAQVAELKGWVERLSATPPTADGQDVGSVKKAM
jgi:hypothetical protein